MAKSLIHNPHDALFKAALQNVNVAREFLMNYLPDDIKKILDFNQITYCPSKFLSAKLKESESDVLLKVNLAGKNAYLFILSEHQSTIDKWMPLRLLEYMCCIWDNHRKQQNNQGDLPAIFPLVFFTGKGPYTGMRAIWELCGSNDELMQKILQSPFHLVDVSQLPDEELLAQLRAGTLGFILRKRFKQQFRTSLKAIVANLNMLDLEKEERYLLELLHYLLNIDDEDANVDNLIELLHDELSPEVEKKMSSMAEKLREEGKEQQALRTAKILLKESFELSVIAKATGLSLTKIKALRKKLTGE